MVVAEMGMARKRSVLANGIVAGNGMARKRLKSAIGVSRAAGEMWSPCQVVLATLVSLGSRPVDMLMRVPVMRVPVMTSVARLGHGLVGVAVVFLRLAGL